MDTEEIIEEIKKEELIAKAVKIQIYCAKKPNSKLKGFMPTIVIVGFQSSGKTWFVSIFAGRFIGGAVRNNAGTRCAVHYVFMNSATESFEITLPGQKTQVVSLEEIGDILTNFMDDIKGKGNGFSMEEVTVVVRSPDAITFSFYDTPGLLPTESDPRNQIILAIIQKYTCRPNSVPIALMQMEASNDITYTAAKARRLKMAIGEELVTKRALVFVTQIDSISNVELNKLQEIKDSVLDAEFSDNVVFMSMVPHRLAGVSPAESQRHPDVTDKDATFDKRNNYIKAFKQVMNRNTSHHILWC